MSDPRRAIPSVDRLVASDAFRDLLDTAPRDLIIGVLQECQAELRSAIASGALDMPPTDPEWYARRTADRLAEIRAPSLRPVINATGVVLHTNLGRAPLPDAAVDAIVRTARGYINLEYDLERGERGSRYTHCTSLIIRLTGAEAALVVNNNAAALVLALNTLARNREVVISRGELVEIGGSFRVPEILERSGAILREVGSTNRTHERDYVGAIGPDTGALLKVHPSNFRVTGFTAEVPASTIAAVAAAHDTPFIHDLGSGLLIDSGTLGLPEEPSAGDAIAEGADIVTMSGDKMLGGPQAGIIAGRAALVERMRSNPLCRAFRVDRLTLAALEATLALYLEPAATRESIPALRMLTATDEELGARAKWLATALREKGVPASVIPGSSAVGGGAFPTAHLPTHLVRLDPPDISASAVESRLRHSDPPIISRITDDSVVLDPRTIRDETLDRLPALIRDALGTATGSHG